MNSPLAKVSGSFKLWSISIYIKDFLTHFLFKIGKERSWISKWVEIGSNFMLICYDISQEKCIGFHIMAIEIQKAKDLTQKFDRYNKAWIYHIWLLEWGESKLSSLTVVIDYQRFSIGNFLLYSLRYWYYTEYFNPIPGKFRPDHVFLNLFLYIVFKLKKKKTVF